MSVYLEVSPSNEELELDFSKAKKNRFTAYSEKGNTPYEGSVAENYCVVLDHSHAVLNPFEVAKPAKITIAGNFSLTTK